MVFIYIYPVLAKFYNTTKNTFINAFLMAIRHLPYTLLMLLITALPVAILYIPTFKVQSLVLMLFVLIGFATIAYINSHFFVKIFDNYIPKENTLAEEGQQEQGNDSQVSGSCPVGTASLIIPLTICFGRCSEKRYTRLH